MRQLLQTAATVLILTTWVTQSKAQIAVGCFQNQLDGNNGGDLKSYQDIYMSQGACTNFCKGQGTSYALTMDGSTCHCANQPPLDANRIEDAKCDKPCMGYPFEMCGGSSSRSVANVLLIGSSTGTPTSPSTSSSGSTTTDAKDGTSTDLANSGKNLNANNPGTFTPGQPSASLHEHESTTTTTREKKKESGSKSIETAPPEDSRGEGREKGASAGAVAASTVAIIGLAALFVFAVVFSKRRRQRLAQAAWTENMLLPSSLVHTSNNDDELEGHDYTRSSPIYHAKKMSQHSVPSPPATMRFPPPPALHPRQSGAMHMQHPSYPPPTMGPHYNNMRAGYQPFPMPPLLSQQQQHYPQDLSHKEPIDPCFNRNPQVIPEIHPEDAYEDAVDHYHVQDAHADNNRCQAPSVRTMSIRQDRRGSGSGHGSGRTSIDTSHSHFRPPPTE